jgi:hypothetical protein
MPRVLILLLFIALFMSSANAQVDKFRFQPDKVPIGTVYHYVKSNQDASDPERISVYVAAKDRLEVFKFHPESPGSRAALVIAFLDWDIFCVKKLESWTMTGLDQKTLTATMEYLLPEKAVTVELNGPEKTVEKTQIPFLPFHVYNFDLTSLNIAMPHLINPEGKFTIGIADPNFAESGPLFIYRGEVQIEFVSSEDRNGIPCRKYKIDGPGLENHGGFIWVDKAKAHFVDLEADLADHPNWKNFKLKLDRTERMSQEQWEAFFKKHFEKP